MRGEVAIGPSIYGVYVIDGSLCSRVYGILGYRASSYIPEFAHVGLAQARPKYIHVAKVGVGW